MSSTVISPCEDKGRKLWQELVDGPCGHFDIAAQFGLYASWNAEGSRAFASVIRKMARLLDDEVRTRVDRDALALAGQIGGQVDNEARPELDDMRRRSPKT